MSNIILNNSKSDFLKKAYDTMVERDSMGDEAINYFAEIIRKSMNERGFPPLISQKEASKFMGISESTIIEAKRRLQEQGFHLVANKYTPMHIACIYNAISVIQQEKN